METNEASMTHTLALLDRMKDQVPELFSQAQVVGKWVWLEFNVPPLKEIRGKLKELGFHWNGGRKCWQHPCGMSRPRSGRDPRAVYPVIPAHTIELNETVTKHSGLTSSEYKLVSLRECPLPESLRRCETPEQAAEYWRETVTTNPLFNPDCECFVVLLLNTRRRVKGHQLVTIGTLDTILVHPREVFRGALIAAAAAVIIMHNHPSGEPTPSEADIKVTRDLIRAGQLLKVEVLDHVIMGNPDHCSLRALGYFYA
jgi:DNA repair protein RadC